MKLIIAYIKRDYHFFRYYLARFKMWRIMQFVRLISCFSKDEDYKLLYTRMRYEFDHSSLDR